MKIVFDHIAKFIDYGATATKPPDNEVLIDQTIRNNENCK